MFTAGKDELSCGFILLLTESPSSRGMFARPASETAGPAWCAARRILQLGSSVWAGIRRRLQALSLHATTVWSPLVHREVQRPFGVYDSALSVGWWHKVRRWTGLWSRCMLWNTSSTCEGKAHPLTVIYVISLESMSLERYFWPPNCVFPGGRALG